jgi:CRP/FNR family transcriptional regulator, cyclic AMP receptor protein
MLARRLDQKMGQDLSRIEHLQAVSLFEDIQHDLSALQALADSLVSKQYKPGETIISENDTGSEMFLLVGGQASVYKSTADGEKYKVVILQGAQHAFFGEGALLDSDARSATIIADTLSQCLVLKREAFERFCLDHPLQALPILRRIARAVMARLRNSNDDLMLLYNALISEIRGH